MRQVGQPHQVRLRMPEAAQVRRQVEVEGEAAGRLVQVQRGHREVGEVRQLAGQLLDQVHLKTERLGKVKNMLEYCYVISGTIALKEQYIPMSKNTF